MKLYDVIRKEKNKNEISIEEKIEKREVVRKSKKESYEKKFLLRRLMVFGSAIAFVTIFYIAGNEMVRAKVIVTEKQIPFSLDAVEFELVPQNDENSGRYSFQTMIVNKEVTRQVYGSDVETSASRANGRVVFFNEYSTKPQVVKAGTTLTGANKMTYKTVEAVTVPGYTTKDKVKSPGISASVAITANAVGPSYNTSGTTFAVSGWSASRSKQFYAQSAGAVSGGDDMIIHSVSEKEQPSVIASLQAQLIESLKRETRSQIPPDLVAFVDLQAVTIDSTSLQLKGEGIKFPASMKGSLTTYLVPREILETMIANHIKGDQKFTKVSIPTINNLTVTPSNGLPIDPEKVPDVLKVKISGEGVIIAKVSTERLKESLIGVPKGEFNEKINQFPEISKARLHLYPFWSSVFPTKSSRIDIEIE